MSIAIYKAQLSELEQLQEICVTAYAQNFSHHWNEGGLDWYLNQQFSLTQLANDIDSLETDYYLIAKDGQLIGFFKLRYNSTEESSTDSGWLELEKIYVLPGQKGGVGRTVMPLIIDIAKNRAAKALMLYVIDTNQIAIDFYQKNGFSLLKRSRLELPYFKDELKGTWQMVKLL